MSLVGTGQHGRQRISRPVLYKLSHAMQRGSIVQEHTLYGLDGLAPAGTVRPILGRDGNAEDEANEPRFGMIMNPYLPPGAIVRQLFVTEPFYDTIAVVNLTVFGTAPYQVFGLASVTRISSPALNLPVDLTPVKRDKDNVSWGATRPWMMGPTSMSPTRATARSFACARTARSSRSDASRSTGGRSTRARKRHIGRIGGGGDTVQADIAITRP
jgi:hypothetical protein